MEMKIWEKGKGEEHWSTFEKNIETYYIIEAF